MGLALGSALLQAARVCVRRRQESAAAAAPNSGYPIAMGSELLLDQQGSNPDEGGPPVAMGTPVRPQGRDSLLSSFMRNKYFGSRGGRAAAATPLAAAATPATPVAASPLLVPSTSPFAPVPPGRG